MRDTAADAFSRRDFWLCLARAFAPPGGGEYLAAFAHDLPDDLAAIAEEIGLVLTAEIASLRAAAGQMTDPMDLQRLYAALFLTPPTPVMMNTGFYIDGGVMGVSEQGLQDAYARHGYARHTEFRDLNDTIGVQAEFLSLLYDKAGEKARAAEGMDARAYLAEADAFIAAYPARWITPFVRDIEAACDRLALNPVYAHLARILWLAVEGSISAPTFHEVKGGMEMLPPGSARGIGALTAEDLAEIAWRLDQDGLSWDHVAENDGWDDAVFAARRAKGKADATVH